MNPAATTWGRLCALLQLLLSTTALVAVIVGIPYVLAASAGVPWPAPVTSLGDLGARLAQPASDPLLTRLLALAGWVYWAAFMVSLIREASWATRQLGTLLGDVTLLRTRLRTLPTHRAAAAFLVGTLLLALTVIWRRATARATATSPASARPPAASAAAPVTPQHQTVRERHIEQFRTTTYMVAPGDTLWDIARAHLGDPLRWPVIYRLNRGRIQDDGHRLHDPDLLHPGWTLHLPTSNDTPTLMPTPHVPTTPQAHGTTVPPATGAFVPRQQQPSPAPQAGAPAQHTGEHPPAIAPGPHRQQHVAEISVGTASVIGVTTAAGIAAAVGFARAHARRRRQPGLTTAAPPPLAHAVRAATTAHLATRHTSSQQSAEQTAETLLQRRVALAEPSAAGTVVCAIRDDREQDADLLAIAGGIALTGPGADAAARALAVAVLSAAERLRPGHPKVRLLTPTATAQRLLADTHLTQPVPAWTITRDCTEALALVERTLLHRARRADIELDEALQDRPPMDLLVCDLDPGSIERLKSAADRAARGQLAVIILNADAWPARAHLDAQGTVTTTTGTRAQPLHGARMFTLAPDPACELLDVLHTAHGHTTPTVQAPPASKAQAPGPMPPASRPQRTDEPEKAPRNTREKQSTANNR
ncbi:LysM peptidoglycan-binding domain-containing protein [Streptantibioticus ferralitis]|uniref:LysM peptidoglycan-binding domain-containing protein n=1 Tax=Streptantibioticus ferralitis TaxID=236510 RepID=A0ABT5ZBC5_9ACTN|nr:LysM peptidoglycan-binding domain-containing protein [Streptantibioticus ferralitis]MDF2261124.1 LysM peptidoglycan-binding domain-containing protein [Streptantibioticus ferralitis]